ncbi:MAG TPA: DUF1360 domain-containing protein [Thermoanaerobaculia bacterium]|nr:DUF1360 domain-containing protein [Thermoanaerobaculia bacterium]
MKAYELVLSALCVWRITHLLQAEDGPWDLVVWLRRAAGKGFFGELLDCFYCLSLWISAPFAWGFGASWKERLLLWPALSAAAILLERLTAPRTGPPPALYIEDEEVSSWPAVESNGVNLPDPMAGEARPPSAASSATSDGQR